MLLNVPGGKIKNWFMFIFMLKMSSLSQEGKEACDKTVAEYFQLF